MGEKGRKLERNNKKRHWIKRNTEKKERKERKEREREQNFENSFHRKERNQNGYWEKRNEQLAVQTTTETNLSITNLYSLTFSLILSLTLVC